MPTKAQMQEQMDRMRARLEELEPDDQEEGAEVGNLADLDDSGGDDIELFLQEAGGPGPAKVVDGYWYDDDGDGRLRFVARWPLEKFDLPTVKDQFGGGRWVFRLKHADTGKFITSKTQMIDGPRRSPKSPSEADDPRSFTDKILDQQGLILETMQEVRAGPPAGAAPADPINMALSIVGAFQSVIAPMQQALLTKEKTEPSFGELVTIFQQGIEMGKLSAPPPPDPMGAVLASTLPGLMNAIGGGNAPPTPNPLDALTNPPGTESETMPEHTADTTTRPGWDVLLSGYMPTILKWARTNVDVELRAAFVVDELSPEAEAIVLDQLRRGPDFFREFMLLHPEAKPWENWLANFWAAVADQYPWGEDDFGPHPFRMPEDPEPTPAPESTDGVEVGTH